MFVKHFSDSPQNKEKLWCTCPLYMLMCSVSLTEGRRDTYRNQLDIRLCIQIERSARPLFWQPRRWWQKVRRGGCRCLQLVHPSSPASFCARSLKQGPYTSGETDIQQVSRWLTVSWLRESQHSRHTDWFCRFSKDYVLMWPCCYETIYKMTSKKEMTFNYSMMTDDLW